MNLLCKLGLHLPLKKNKNKAGFRDAVSGLTVCYYNCPCGRGYMANDGYVFGFRVETDESVIERCKK